MASRSLANYRCPDCHEPVIRATTDALNKQLLNPEPDPAGNVHAYNRNGNWIARYEAPGTAPVPPDQVFMPHAATCQPRHPQLPAEPAQNVTQLDGWRKAQSAHSARQRAGRGRRPGKPVTGIRWRPR